MLGIDNPVNSSLLVLERLRTLNATTPEFVQADVGGSGESRRGAPAGVSRLRMVAQ